MEWRSWSIYEINNKGEVRMAQSKELIPFNDIIKLLPENYHIQKVTSKTVGKGGMHYINVTHIAEQLKYNVENIKVYNTESIIKLWESLPVNKPTKKKRRRIR